VKEYRCDVPGCPMRVSGYRRTEKSVFCELQHHLWMSHKVDVIESHRRAAAIVEPKKEKNVSPR